MGRAKTKRFVSHYLLVGSAMAGKCFVDGDGSTIVLHLAKGTSLNWRDTKKLRLLPIRPRTASPLPAESFA
jgi:hypothetical protein